MKRAFAFCSLSALAFSLLACNQAPPDTHDADVQAIKDTETQWVQDYAAKDAGKLAAHYADDARLVIPGMPAMVGKDAIQAALKGFVTDPALSLQFQATRVEVAKSGDLGVTHGTYTMAMTDPQTKQVIHDHGDYVTGYRKQADGSWKAVTDISASEVPPPAPAPEPASAKKKH